MRGIVFTEFLDFVEEEAGPEMVETMIEACDLPSEGAYTAVGYYDHDEMLKMVTFLHNATGNEVSEMVRAFGAHFFEKLAASHPSIMNGTEDMLGFLETIETHIHKEVRKLYPDAELPHFKTERPSPKEVVMYYSSSRPFTDLAEGLIQGCAKYFGNSVTVTRRDLTDDEQYRARFDVKVE